MMMMMMIGIKDKKKGMKRMEDVNTIYDVNNYILKKIFLDK